MANLDTKNMNDIKKWRSPVNKPIHVLGYLGGMMPDKHHFYKLVDDNYGEKVPIELKEAKNGQIVSIKAESVTEAELLNIKRGKDQKELSKD